MSGNMNSEDQVLCGANSYVEKFYMNPAFSALPEEVKQELRRITVGLTEDIGGIVTLEFRDGEDGKTMVLRSMHDESDYLFDEIDAHLKVDRVTREYEELFGKLTLYVRALEQLRSGALKEEELEDFLESNAAGEDQGDFPEGNPVGEEQADFPEGNAAGEDQADFPENNIAGVEREITAGSGTIRKTGEWDIPVHPEDEDAENSAYHTLFGE